MAQARESRGSLAANFPRFAKALSWPMRRLQLYRQRQAFLHTVALNDRMLDDIGLTRSEVEWAAQLPLKLNAAIEIRRVANRRRGQRPLALR